MSHAVDLLIAGFRIRLQSDSPLYIDLGHRPFVVETIEAPPDILLTCVADLPIQKTDYLDVLFDASEGEKTLYRVFREDAHTLGYLLYDQSQSGVIQQVLYVDSAGKQGTIHRLPDKANRFDVLKFPLGPILLYYLSVKNNAILIHASGVFDGNHGRLFTGFSGFGKSTMAGLWQAAGNQIINDDRLIVRKLGNRYWMHNTPMPYQDVPKSAPLDAIHLIRHAPRHSLQRLTGAKAIANVMAFCIQNNFEASLIINNVTCVSDIASLVPIYQTGFLPEPSVVSYILDHED